MLGFGVARLLWQLCEGKFVDGESVGDWLVGTDSDCLTGTVVNVSVECETEP